jgi:hypothetical protein
LTNQVQKLKPQEFVTRFEELLLDEDIRNILVRGYFDDDKLLLTFSCLGNLKKFNNGTIVIGNTTVPHERELLQRSLRGGIPKLNLSDLFNINGLNIDFLQWKRNRDIAFGFDKDFSIFHSVESALGNRDFYKFCSTLKNVKAKKNILITTNDFDTMPEKLYPYVDAILVLDTTDVNEDHQKTYKVIQANLKTDHQVLPY